MIMLVHTIPRPVSPLHIDARQSGDGIIVSGLMKEQSAAKSFSLLDGVRGSTRFAAGSGCS